MWSKIKSVLKRISILGFLLIIVAIPVIYYATLGVMRLTVRATEPIPLVRPAPIAVGENIPAGRGSVTVAEMGDYTMSVNTANLNITIAHTPTRREFNTLLTTPLIPAAARSPLIIRFLGEDSMMYEWDAYNYVISNDQFSMYKIEDGVQFVLHFQETESTRLLEYIPARISIDRFHEVFIDEMAYMEAAGTLSAEDADRFRRGLNLVYTRDDAEGVYFYGLGGLPPPALVSTLIEMTRVVGYTRDILINDLYSLGIEAHFVEPAAFTVTMNHTLTADGEFIVDIPVIEHVNGNEFFTLQNLRIYPAFDATHDDNDGFIFVPDGSGKLIALNSFDIRRTAFNRPVFRNNMFDQDILYWLPAFEEELHMPVFGMWHTDARGQNSGFFTIIESGSQTSHIGTTLRASAGAGPMFNSVFSSIDTMQFSRVRIFGPYSDEDARFLATTGPLNPHIRLRYVLFPEGAGYFEFAQTYRQFLIDNYGFEVSFDNRPKIFMEFIGAISTSRNFIGIPYSHNLSMTSFAQASYIIDDLRGEGVNVVANFKHGLNGGSANFVGNNARPVRSLGSQQDFDRLLAQTKPGGEVFVEANLIRAHRSSTRFDARRFWLSDYSSGQRLWITDQFHPDGGFFGTGWWSMYSFIHPNYLPFVVDGFMDSASGRIQNVTLTDFGNLPYGNFDPRDIVSPFDAQLGVLRPMLEQISNEMTIALDNPNFDRLHFATYALNISRESSATGVFYTSIPFRQLVMNGIVEFTTLDVNGAPSALEYFLLQALELGAIPKFTVFYEPTSALINIGVTYYFSHEYRRLRDDILWLAQSYEEAFARIGTKEIVNHETLQPGVFVTTYANGVRVYVNYNLFSVSGEGFALEALGFYITGGA